MAKKETTVKASSKKVAGGGASGDAAVIADVTVATADAVKSRPAGKGAAKKVPAITITDIGDHLAATFDIPKSHAKIYLNEAVALIGKQLRKGSKVRLSGLGVFQVKKRAARKARNPNTGEEVKVKAGKRVVFAASQDLKTKL